MKHKTRESWLRAMAELIYKEVLTLKIIRSLPLQIIKGNALEGGSMTRVPLSKVQISCAYAPNMRVGQVVKEDTVDAKVRAIGTCFYARKVKDEDGKVIASFDTNIFITPRENDPVTVTEILIHELIHPITKGHGHKGSFKTLCETVGLRLTPGGNGHTSAMPLLQDKIKGMAKKLGKYPHKKWVPSAQYKKQTTRMFKMTSLGVMCEPAEGFKNSWVATPFTCRVSRLAMSAGFPMDPDGKSMFLEVTKDELEQLCLHPVTPDEYKNHTMQLPSGGRGISEDAYKLTQMVGVDLIKSGVADNVLTRDENAVMFEIACMANSSCGMWASELVNDNHSWFTNKEIKDMMPWNEAYTMQVLRSLKEKDVIAYDMIDMGDEGPKHHGFVNVYLSDSDDGKVEKSSAYKVMKSYDGLDPHRANPFMIESGASSPCPQGPVGHAKQDHHGWHYVWSVHFSSQGWLLVPHLEACGVAIPSDADGCKESGRVLFDNGFSCEKHYNEMRTLEVANQEIESYIEFCPDPRPELEWKKSERIETENILESLSPDEGGPVDGKDWIQELNETEKGEV